MCRAALAALVAAALLAGCAGSRGAPDPAAGDGGAGQGSVVPTAPSPAPPSPAPIPAPAQSAAPTPGSLDPLDAGELSPAEDPGGLAAQIETAERAIRSDGADTGRLERAGRLQQMAYRRLSRHPEWRDAVLAALPEDLHRAVEANVGAGQQLRSLVNPGTELPDWRIVAPAPADELLAHYREAEQRYGVGWEYLAAIHLVETRMGRIRGDSVAGARGPMQFMPQTWEAYGEGDVEDDRDAIMAAARYLVDHGAPDDMPRALWHYNHSDAYVAAISAYAGQMRADLRAFHGYYHWQVFFATADGDVLLEVGYGDESAG